ncbi:hypothetical protein DCS_06873 [Drechmeria coniospora]|uniref:SCP domain-containing protein n=1 Tax=Drechmeria coniospora TaxID=98403 RepID=A0A151GCS6_DRECN|nr:hypothetical protein DCS_06873 [Drechmeria coniospora]KYK54912.1 hypothetical protein DCS_06873 [Drechmeria coniospora]
MHKLTASCSALALFLANVQSVPISATGNAAPAVVQARALDDWQKSLSDDTRHRLDLALENLKDDSAPGQAFRNDTIMRVNIEREALDLSLIDLSQAFGSTLPASRSSVSKVGVIKRSEAEDFREESYTRSGGMTYPKVIEQRSNAEDFREESYTRSGGMTYPKVVEQRSDVEDFREESYTRSGGMTYPKVIEQRSDAEDFREESYTRSGGMTYPKVIEQRSNAEDFREESYTRSGGMTYPKVIEERSDAEDFREESYTRSGGMTYPKVIEQRSDAEDFREESYTRSGGMTYPKVIEQRSDAEDFREESYTRSGGMTYPKVIEQRSDAEDFREESYTRSGGMTYPKVIEQRSDAEDFREESYTRSGGMTYPKVVEQRSTKGDYSTLLNRENLALGAIERINIAHRVRGVPEVTMEQAKEIGSHGDDYISGYWASSVKHGDFWTLDQAAGKPNFIEGGQANGFGFTQSTFHKLHCLANLRMILSWHMTGNGAKLTRDMNMHTIHCLEYIRGRELASPDLNEEPIDTVDYKGMGIH